MDSYDLSELIYDQTQKQYWLKPMGVPGTPVGTHPEAGNETVRADFSKDPSAIQIGDILLVYRIVASRLLYVARVTSEPKEATPEEIARENWRGRWHWGIEALNLTPGFGADWKHYDLGPFIVVKEYNALHPEDEQNLAPIQHGLDKLQISQGFAKFIFHRMMDL